jgi:hypothetical protein
MARTPFYRAASAGTSRTSLIVSLATLAAQSSVEAYEALSRLELNEAECRLLNELAAQRKRMTQP